MKNFIKQENKTSCATSVTKMMLSKYHDNQEFLGLNIKLANNSFLAIKETLKQYKVEVEGVKIEDKSYLDKLNFCISQLKTSNAFHYVIFLKKKKQLIYLLDPEVGLRILKEAEYQEISTGNYLIYKSKEDYPLKKVNYKSLPHFITYGASFILDFFFIYMFTFLKGDLKVVSLLILGVVANFILKLIVILSYDNFIDKKMIIPNLGNSQELEYRINIKATFIERYFKGIAYLFLTILLIIMLISDSYYSLILIVFDAFLMIFKYFSLDPVIIRFKEEISFQERRIKELDQNNYLKLKKSSLKILLSHIIYYLIFSLFSLLFALLINHLLSSDSFTHLIFIFFTNFTLFELISKLKKEDDKLKQDYYFNSSKLSN